MESSNIAVRMALWLLNCNASCAELSNHCFEIRYPEIDHPALFGIPEVSCILLKRGKRGSAAKAEPMKKIVAVRAENRDNFFIRLTRIVVNGYPFAGAFL